MAVRTFVLTALALALTSAAASAKPVFVLKDAGSREQGIAREADWRSERMHEGIGWIIATTVRGDESIMRGGYTVILPVKGDPTPLRHFYVLAAFDLLPSGYLLLTIRDPELYWDAYDYTEGVTDPLELVWYDKGWTQHYAHVLEFPEGAYPDNFLLSPDERYLLAITHPEGPDGEPAERGHRLHLIDLKFFDISELWLPEYDELGTPPVSWWPVLLDWGEKGGLLVQAGKQLRRYEVVWE